MFITYEIRVQSQASPCRIYDGKSGTGTGSFRVLRFRLVIVVIIPPVHHTHLFNYHRRCTYNLSNRQRKIKWHLAEHSTLFTISSVLQINVLSGSAKLRVPSVSLPSQLHGQVMLYLTIHKGGPL